MATFYKTFIKEIKQETANAVSLVFNIPENLKSEFKFTSGQYITLKKEINGEEVRRAYSICSTPESEEIRVAVKAVENGTFSVYATKELKAGDDIEISAPEGRFLLKPEPNKNYIAFAAGSGITPILSMVKSVLENESSSTFTLVYGNKSVADTIFYSELNTLKETYSNRLKLHYIFSREDVKNQSRGRIDKNVTNYFVKNMYKETTFNASFLCGPEKMIEAVSNTLQEIYFSKENIHFELFTVSEKEDVNLEIEEGTSKVTVMLDDEETSFSMSQKDNILAASLRNDLDPPYSCQGGVCSSCLAIVTEGKAVMTKNTILSAEEVNDGYILTCQAHPTTSKIHIDFDEV